MLYTRKIVLALWIGAALFLPVMALAQTKTVSIFDYGAKPGDAYINTVFIQKAIDETAASGGGTVVIPAGKFVTGSIALKTGVNLSLEENAILAGSIKRSDYDLYANPALVVAENQQHIGISGKGTIDGQATALLEDIMQIAAKKAALNPSPSGRPPEGDRTNLVHIKGCKYVAIRGVTFKDATSWVTHYEQCEDLTIDSIKIESVTYWNNDGIDITDCKKVKITNAVINSSDDGICLKSETKGRACEDVFVSDCTIRSSANAFKLGTSSVGGFKNIMVRNLKVYDTYRSAVALEAVDGGTLENVDVAHILARNTGSAILIRLGHRNKDSVYSVVRNIKLDDITVEVPAGKPDAGYQTEGPLLMYPPGFINDGMLHSVSPWNYKSWMPGVQLYKHNVFPSSITGLPGHPVENVLVTNTRIVYHGGASKDANYFPVDSFDLVTEATKDYPEFSMFGELPAWGMYLRHVKNLALSNVSIEQQKPDYRTGILINDGAHISLNNVSIQGNTTMPALLVNGVTGLSMEKLEMGVRQKEAVDIRHSTIKK